MENFFPFNVISLCFHNAENIDRIIFLFQLITKFNYRSFIDFFHCKKICLNSLFEVHQIKRLILIFPISDYCAMQ